ncbi:MAG: helix-turn-helix domain-containing protein [Gammaproteobacteria bacterium]|nr:helix-turn-helix domain-containing protein [Gammaproteobacteria bacterium]
MPTSAKKSNPVKRSIGSLLKARRTMLGLTLQELADGAELSAAFLSQVERGKATPSIVSLINIAGALETDIHYFITPPAPTSLVRRADNPHYIDIDSPVVYKRLDAKIRNQQMNALLMEVPPGVELPVVHRAEGEDFFYVLEGEVEQSIGDEVFTLRQGDSAHHNTQVDHSVVNKSGHVAKLLWVGTPLLFPPSQNEIDSD